MLVPPPPSRVKILYWAVPSSMTPRSSAYDANLAGTFLLPQLGDGRLAGGGVARLVVEVDEVDLRAAGRLDVLGGEVQTARHRLAVERAGAGQGEHGAGVDGHALARCRGVDAQQRGRGRRRSGRRPSCRRWPPSSPRRRRPWWRLRPMPSWPPPPDAVVAVLLLLELSLPQAARTLGASATAAPAAPRRVSTCRRVTRPSCTGRCGSFSVIPAAPCVVAGRPARHVQRNSRRARLMRLRGVRSAPIPRSEPYGRARFVPCAWQSPRELQPDVNGEPQLEFREES